VPKTTGKIGIKKIEMIGIRTEMSKIANLDSRSKKTQADFCLVPKTTQEEVEEILRNRLPSESTEVGIFFSNQNCSGDTPLSSDTSLSDDAPLRVERVWKVNLLMTDWLSLKQIGRLLILIDPVTGKKNHVEVVRPCFDKVKKDSQHQVRVQVLTEDEVAVRKAKKQKFLFLPASERFFRSVG
jgi:hypothetical protein